ncbi:MAG TPA: insulinase family protein [Clostridiaceae bacterium]|nr:insulinase family protein [Clostridiaceae bacterium]
MDTLENNISLIESFCGIDVYLIKTNKFKTNTVNIFFHDVLDEERATKNALIPAVLRRGCQKLPTYQDIALYLEELYGTVFDCGVAKKGERQLMHFYMEFLADIYADSDDSLFQKAFEVIFEIITQPVLENGMFKEDYLKQEKENLRKLIESRINDKVQYAVDRCYEEMCKGEPFSVYEYGSVAQLEEIGNKDLYDYYKTCIETLPMQVFLTGNISDDNIRFALKKLKSIKRRNLKELSLLNIKSEIQKVREVTEKMDVNQGKLSLGFRTNIFPGDKEYYPLALYTSILGGGIHSKLFQNVREKQSLAYYIFSRQEIFKGLLLVSCGIEIENKEKAVKIIIEQVEEIKRGNISDYEYESALKTMETGVRSLQDSQIQMVDFFVSQIAANTKDNFETLIEKLRKVTKQDIIKVAEKVQLDTIYFLTSK